MIELTPLTNLKDLNQEDIKSWLEENRLPGQCSEELWQSVSAYISASSLEEVGLIKFTSTLVNNLAWEKIETKI